MKEKCFIPLYESVETIQKVIDMAWDIIPRENPTPGPGHAHSISAEDIEYALNIHRIQGPPTEMEYKKEKTRAFLETLDRKMLNSINIVMAIGKDSWAIDDVFDSPLKEFEEYAEWLHLEDKMDLGKESHINYLMTKSYLKKELKEGLRLLRIV